MSREKYLKSGRGRTGFTLIEVLIVVILFSVVVLAVYGVARGGLEVYRRSQNFDRKERKIILSLERLAEDLRQIIPLDELDSDLAQEYQFGDEEISFIICGKEGLQRLRYVFKDEKLHLIQTDVKEERIQLERDLVSGIKKPSSDKLFQYLKYDDARDIYGDWGEWEEEEEKKDMPVAVRVEIAYEAEDKDEENIQIFTKTIFIPH